MQPSALLAVAALLFFCVIDAQNTSPIVLSHWSFDHAVTAQSRGVGWNTTQVGNNSCSPASAPTCDVSVTPAHGDGFLSTAIYASLNTSADDYYLLQNTSRSSNISIAAYVYLTQIIGAYNVLQKQTATELWRFEVANGFLSFASSDVDSNTTVTYTSAQQISLNKWQYVTFSFISDTEQVTMSINMQPQPISLSNSDYVASPPMEGGTIEFTIGNGAAIIDELQLIAGVISGQDTLNLIQHNKLISPQLHVGYDYDDPFNPLLDRSGNGFHLQSTGVVNTTVGAVKTAVLIESQLSSTVGNFMCNPLLGIPLGFTITTYINSNVNFSSIITISNENQILFALDIAPLNNSVFVSFNNVSAGIIYSPQPWAHIAIVVDSITSQLSVYNDAHFVHSTYVNVTDFCQFGSQDYITLTLGGVHNSLQQRRLLTTGGIVVDQTNVYGTAIQPPYIYYTMNNGSNCYSDLTCASFWYPLASDFNNMVTGIPAIPECNGTQFNMPLFNFSTTVPLFGSNGSLQYSGPGASCSWFSVATPFTDVFTKITDHSDFTITLLVQFPIGLFTQVPEQSLIFIDTETNLGFNSGGSNFYLMYTAATRGEQAQLRIYGPNNIFIPASALMAGIWHQFAVRWSWELQFATRFDMG